MTLTNADTNCTITGTQLNFVTKDYLIDAYPNLVSQFKQSGLWVWGQNGNGQLGNNSTADTSTPVQTVSSGTNWQQISMGYSNVSAGIKTDGRLWTWGSNLNGELGDNTTIAKSSPVQTIGAATNWRQVSCNITSIHGIKTDGTLWCWGLNVFGTLGTNNTTNRSSPVQTISTGTNWTSVSANWGYAVAALKTGGTLWTWGYNVTGNLGINNTINQSSPVQTISTGTNWASVSMGQGNCAGIKTDGTLWIWGSNSNGELGDNTRISKSSPVQTIGAATNWSQVSCGAGHTAAIKTDGTLWTWGANSLGQLGDNTTIRQSSPIQTVSGGTNWKFCFAGYQVQAALKTNGSLWTWGENTSGYLGTGDVTHRSSPVQTIFQGTNWKTVSGQGYSFGGIRDDSADLFGDPL